MPRHHEEEIKGPLESASQGLFSHQISRLGRPVKLPKRYRENQEVLPVVKTGIRKNAIKKRSTHKQPTIHIHEDDECKDAIEASLPSPLPLAKEFQIETEKDEPEWVQRFNAARLKTDKYSILEPAFVTPAK